MMTNMPRMQSKPNLDLLRTLAVLCVVLDHTLLAQNIATVGHWQSAWIGVVGVYWFFVHTSLVLMWSLERKPHTLDFYIRRAFRIYPLVIVTVLATALFHLPIASGGSGLFSFYPAPRREVLFNCLLLQNVAFGNHFIGVLWSLPLEVDMYLLLPVLFFFLQKNFSLWPLLLFWILGTAVVRFQNLVGNNFLTVIPCFLPGIIAYVLYRRTVPRLPAWLFPVFLFALAALFMHQPSVNRSWPMCLALGLALPLFRQIVFGPLIWISHQVAKYSYGIYLTHSIALVLGFHVLHGLARPIQLGTALLTTVVLSVAAYHLVEKPLIDVGARVAATAERRYEQKHIAQFA